MKKIYKEINRLKSQSSFLKGIAIDECLSYNEAKNLRNTNSKISNKINFYENLVKAMKKKGI